MKYGGNFLFESSMNWVRIIKGTKDLKQVALLLYVLKWSISFAPISYLIPHKALALFLVILCENVAFNGI